MSNPSSLIIQVPTNFCLGSYGISVESLRGQFLDIYYFKVSIAYPPINSDIPSQVPEKIYDGLLRVGTPEGRLSQEIALREQLSQHRMVGSLLLIDQLDAVTINLDLGSAPAHPEFDQKEQSLSESHLPENTETALTQSHRAEGEDYLEEEFYHSQSIEITINSALISLIQLTSLEDCLEDWLKQEKNLKESLPILIQICQFANYLHKQGWCFTQINPALISLQNPIQFYDLTGIFRIGEIPSHGLTGSYCPPELALGHSIDAQMSSFVIGALLYQIVHHHQPRVNENIPLVIKPIPGIYQILRVCLAPNGDRPPVDQLLSTLVETQKLLSTPTLHWEYQGQSTLGLSENRWKNEDHYGVRQQSSSNPLNSLMIGIIADGMGGMAQGEIASQIAVQTLITTPLLTDIYSLKSWNDWLIKTIQQANQKIFKAVRNGGTTLSVVLAIGSKLLIAHVGDSRIFLIRNGFICQLSQDHSFVSVLFNTGKITQAEMRDHPDRSVLTKSLGSSHNLPKSDIQNLSFFKADELSIDLEDQDTLLLCSDGIWDLIPETQLCEIFCNCSSLTTAVNQVISQVLDQGANDNATLLSLRCTIASKPDFQ
jgi:protein phosphatase